MKEKKGKKALEDLHSLKKRSNSISTISASRLSTLPRERTISDLPFSYSIDRDSIEMCNILGEYDTTNKYVSKLIYLGGGRANEGEGGYDMGGWHYFNNGYSSFKNHPKYNFGGRAGFLFLFFETKSQYTGGICSKCYKDNHIPGEKGCYVFDTNQGKIFAVLINTIDEINALNRTLASQSRGIYLSNTIKDILINNPNGDHAKGIMNNVISRLYDSQSNSSPLMSHNPSPLTLMLASDEINFPCFQNVETNVKNSIILLIHIYDKFAFHVSSTSYLTVRGIEKIPFDVERIEGEESELVNRNTIKFLKSGTFTFTLFFRHEYFEDTENIFGNPTGPTTYGQKNFSLKFKATVAPLSLKFKVPTISIEMLKDGNIKKIDLSELLIDNINIENININNLKYKLEPIHNTQFNVTDFTSDNRTFIAISSSFGEGGCKLTVSYIDNTDKYSISTSVNLFWKFKVPEVFFTLATSNPPISISSPSQVELPLRLHYQESNINVYVYPIIKLIPPYYVDDVSYFYFYSTDGDYSIYYRDVTFSIENLKGNAYINLSVGLGIEVYYPFSSGNCNLIANYKGQIFKLELNWQVQNDTTKTHVIKIN